MKALQHKFAFFVLMACSLLFVSCGGVQNEFGNGSVDKELFEALHEYSLIGTVEEVGDVTTLTFEVENREVSVPRYGAQSTSVPATENVECMQAVVCFQYADLGIEEEGYHCTVTCVVPSGTQKGATFKMAAVFVPAKGLRAVQWVLMPESMARSLPSGTETLPARLAGGWYGSSSGKNQRP